MAPRVVVICVDDSDASEEAVKWAMANIFKSGDEIHIVSFCSVLFCLGLLGCLFGIVCGVAEKICD